MIIDLFHFVRFIIHPLTIRLRLHLLLFLMIMVLLRFATLLQVIVMVVDWLIAILPLYLSLRFCFVVHFFILLEWWLRCLILIVDFDLSFRLGQHFYRTACRKEFWIMLTLHHIFFCLRMLFPGIFAFMSSSTPSILWRSVWSVLKDWGLDKEWNTWKSGNKEWFFILEIYDIGS